MADVDITLATTLDEARMLVDEGVLVGLANMHLKNQYIGREMRRWDEEHPRPATMSAGFSDWSNARREYRERLFRQVKDL